MIRVGLGFDVHRFAEGRPCIIGGVTIPHEKGLAGHSDADVLLHAIADALLGAAALGDIGTLFPNTDERWRGADSLEMLGIVRQTIADAGYQVGNVDATLVLQEPKIRPYVDQMRGRIAQALHVTIDRVSVKATTAERLGYVGAGEGAEAYAVCAIFPASE